jgi:hypothetical protein
MSHPIHENEAERLGTLRGYEILDTRPEERFDDLTRLAALICGTPIALVSLVDEDRQWFKSKVGFETPQTRREDAFCAHAIMSPDLLVVADASQDARFSANPMVLGESHFRLYAGAPLTAPNGHHIGALCVIDREPRHLSHEQLESLRVLGRQVMAQVTLGKNLRDLKIALKRRDELEADMARLIQDLQGAKIKIQSLESMIPMCAWCKRVRDDHGYWERVEAYVAKFTGAYATSSICPECFLKNFGEFENTGEPPNSSPSGI